MRGVQCLKSLYLHKKRPYLRDKLSPEQLAKFQRGSKIGIIAQKLFPGGVDLRPRSYRQYAQKIAQTKQIISSREHTVLYEAGFQYDQLLTFLDILVMENEEWVAYEVKSSHAVSETFILDAAFQYYVITGTGVSLKDFYILHVNKEFDFKNFTNLNDLFIKQSVLKEILERQAFIKEQVEREKEILNYTHSPQIEPGNQCTNPYPCDFIGHCWKKIPKEQHPVIEYKDEGFYDFVDELLNKLS